MKTICEDVAPMYNRGKDMSSWSCVLPWFCGSQIRISDFPIQGNVGLYFEMDGCFRNGRW